MQILLNGLIIGSAYALFAIGFTLWYGTLRYFDLSFAMIGVVGAYVALTMMDLFGVSYLPGLFIGAFIAVVVGFLIYFGLFRVMKRRGSSPLVLLVASFGVLTVLQNIVSLFWGNGAKVLSLSDLILPAYDFFGLLITPNQLMIGAVAISFMVLLEFYLSFTKMGMAIRAIGDNLALSKVLGVKTEQIILIVLCICFFVSSVGATLVALESGLRPIYGVSLIVKAIIAAIIGSLGSIRGALLGGLLLGVVENIGIYFVGGGWQNTVAFLLLTVFLLARPEGMFAKKKLVSLT